MKTFPNVILGGGLVAGYAAKEFAALGGETNGLALKQWKCLSNPKPHR